MLPWLLCVCVCVGHVGAASLRWATSHRHLKSAWGTSGYSRGRSQLGDFVTHIAGLIHYIHCAVRSHWVVLLNGVYCWGVGEDVAEEGRKGDIEDERMRHQRPSQRQNIDNSIPSLVYGCSSQLFSLSSYQRGKIIFFFVWSIHCQEILKKIPKGPKMSLFLSTAQRFSVNEARKYSHLRSWKQTMLTFFSLKKITQTD